MKPRYEPVAKEVKDMMTKAELLVKRLDVLEKAEECPMCGLKKAHCMVQKNDCGMKKYGDMKKGVVHLETTHSTQPAGQEFHIVSGESARNAFYGTNNALLDSEVVKNSGAINETPNLETLNKKLNPHDLNIKLDDMGGKSPTGSDLE
tara:strand:- start:2904 stop:3347 length:444 start_codon:yes stop_codon:yes gene_type:complete